MGFFISFFLADVKKLIWFFEKNQTQGSLIIFFCIIFSEQILFLHLCNPVYEKIKIGSLYSIQHIIGWVHIS
jgi:hypothetical protein